MFIGGLSWQTSPGKGFKTQFSVFFLRNTNMCSFLSVRCNESDNTIWDYLFHSGIGHDLSTSYLYQQKNIPSACMQIIPHYSCVLVSNIIFSIFFFICYKVYNKFSVSCLLLLLTTIVKFNINYLHTHIYYRLIFILCYLVLNFRKICANLC